MRVRALLASVLALTAALLGTAVSQADPPSGFDKDAAVKAIALVDLGTCKAQSGEGHVLITFDTKGKAKEVVVDKGEFGSSKVGKCITAKFKKVTVPPFDGPPVRVGKTFRVE
jgi:hypothetical protein